MPNIKSAIKRDAISKARRQRNLANKSRLHTARRAFLAEIDKAAKKGAITKNAAARRKSRAAALAAKKA